jgi:hypothetical protein
LTLGPELPSDWQSDWVRLGEGAESLTVLLAAGPGAGELMAPMLPATTASVTTAAAASPATPVRMAVRRLDCRARSREVTPCPPRALRPGPYR